MFLSRRSSVLTCVAVVRSALRVPEPARAGRTPLTAQQLLPGLMLSHPLLYRTYHTTRASGLPLLASEHVGSLVSRQPPRLALAAAAPTVGGGVVAGLPDAASAGHAMKQVRQVHSGSASGSPAESQAPFSGTPVAASPRNGPMASLNLEPLTVVLDMDETLLHTELPSNDSANGADGVRQAEDRDVATKLQGLDYFDHHFQWDGQQHVAVVRKRPHLRAFLEGLKALGIRTFVFTAGVEEYASPLLDRLDPEGDLIARRFYRDHCRVVGRFYVKDLSVVGTPLPRTVLVDNNPVCFLPQPDNGVPVPSFYDDPQDGVLPALLELFKGMTALPDVRTALVERFQLSVALEKAGLTMQQLQAR